ncbi:MAG: DUF4270 family protein [Flavobacteriaceae bacterium]|nr:DUF4270 family protein [Flavobacteriaceae bacterium]MCY4266264.1 DUF4270 family protein [Flavobacteriaceae bacterium]MCY4297943.1 DUF4270 family protein [Flavobacteriaceae bacterium]
MKPFNRFIYFVFSVIFFLGCEREYHPVGKSLFDGQRFISGKQRFPVYTYQKKNVAVQSNGLPTAQLGKSDHPIFGRNTAKIISALTIANSPRFGDFQQLAEDTQDDVIQENERVTQVFLELPFFTNQRDADNDGVIDSRDANPKDPNSDSDGDGITDFIESQRNTNPLSEDSDGDGINDNQDTDNAAYDTENQVYAIDSIYGNRLATFNLKIHELTYYLNELDPIDNFESQEIYYTNQDLYKQGFVGQLLADHQVTLDFEEIRINYEVDDPSTEDIDETTRAETRLSPRIRIPLDPTFFQDQILSKEGGFELESNGRFREHFKGIIIQPDVDSFTDDLYMILDMNRALIRIHYQYDKIDANDASQTTVEKSQLLINVNGLRLNILENQPIDDQITKRVNSSKEGKPADKIYIQGGQFHGALRLFENQTDDQLNQTLQELRANFWLINEANIVFHVDPSTPKESFLAKRLYLYDYNTGMPLSDYGEFQIDQSTNNPDIDKERFGGILELDEQDNPVLFKFRITDHIFNILRNDAPNVELGLVATSDINNIVVSQALQLNGQTQPLDFPQSAIINPLGVVLVGSNPESSLQNKKVELEIIYTQP